MKSLTLQLNSLPTGYEWAAFGDDSSLRKLCRERKMHFGVFRKDSASEGLLSTLHGRKKSVGTMSGIQVKSAEKRGRLINFLL